jgi:hypothetical protein
LKKSVPPLRTKKEIIFTPSAFDHNIDIIGDEWEDLEDEEPAMPSLIKFKEKHVPEHPYCTNWPVSKEEKK